jgi:chorismate dehydratase
MRIGRIPYLNCEPFFAHLGARPGMELAPRALGRALRAGDIDAGPLSLVDLLDLGRAVVPLPYGIAVRGPVQSVLLFSACPPGDLAGATIAVTEETSTSVELLRVLLTLRFEVEPGALVPEGERADALLLIGDAALRARGEERGRPYRLDLAAEWTCWTGLPFVFARWGVAIDVPAAEREALVADLEVALERSLQPLELQGIARRRRDTGLDEAGTLAYLQAFTYRLGPDEDKAIAEFRRYRGFVDRRRC